MSEKRIENIAISSCVLRAALIFLWGWGVFAVIETVSRLLTKTEPWPYMIFLTLLLYCGAGVVLGGGIGALTGMLLKMTPRWQQKIKSTPLFMSCGTVILMFFPMGIFIYDQLLPRYSFLPAVLVHFTLGAFILVFLTVLYAVFSKIEDGTKLYTFYLAFTVTLYTAVIGGLYINEEVLSGTFFNFDFKRVFANGGIAAASVILYVVVYSIVSAAGRRVHKVVAMVHFKTVTAVALVLLISGGVFLYSTTHPDEQRTVAELSHGSEERPNIILITMDTTRADHLSCYGYRKNTTPNLGVLAEESVVFTNAYATSPWTLPSHASIFTSMYPATHGSRYDWEAMQSNWPVRLNKRCKTMAESLTDHGYKTAGVIGGFWVKPVFGLAQGFQYYDHALINVIVDLEHFMLFRLLSRWVSLEDIAARQGLNLSRVASQINKIVFSWLKKHGQSPFFLFVNYYDPHHPYLPPERYALPFRETENGLLEEDQRNRRDLVARYDGEIAYLDHHMGELFEKLKQLGIYDNTMMIITSDHGEFFGEHDLWYHSHELYEEVIKIPLIIKFPSSHFRKGVCSKRVSQVDILPTVLNFLKLPLPEDVQGVDLFEGDSRVMSEIYRHADVEGPLKEEVFVRELKALFLNNYKYIKEYTKESGAQDGLYDIDNDPGELCNLIEKEPEKAKEMEAKLMEWLPQTDLRETAVAPVKLNQATRDGLEALGYIQR